MNVPNLIDVDDEIDEIITTFDTKNPFINNSKMDNSSKLTEKPKKGNFFRS